MDNFQRLCRACSNEKSNLLNLHVADDNDEPTLCDMYISVTMSKITENDGLPQSICYTCAKKLEVAFKFQKSCQKAEAQFTKIYGENSNHLEQNFEQKHLKYKRKPTNWQSFNVSTKVFKECKIEDGFSVEFKTDNLEQKAEEAQQKTTIVDVKNENDMEESEKQITCDECSKKFYTNVALKLHKKIHNKAKSISIQPSQGNQNFKKIKRF